LHWFEAIAREYSLEKITENQRGISSGPQQILMEKAKIYRGEFRLLGCSFKAARLFFSEGN